MTDLHGWITQQVDRVEQSVEEDVLPSGEAAAVLRRCESDRRILARHRLDPDKSDWSEATMCAGCGTYSDCDWPVTDNLNDCPELLDLAHAHGITDEILASLDRPQPPERKIRDSDLLGPGWRLIGSTPPDVPPALRGPNWKADT
ncbi:hypothetical protein [Streptomyces lavendulocolor]|uniref:hypothetical protein n=1 Tax=Streptomyces lavendulocolor TaxID=67316 RepID=UPI0033E57352